jgi:hypothetical protein
MDVKALVWLGVSVDDVAAAVGFFAGTVRQRAGVDGRVQPGRLLRRRLGVATEQRELLAAAELVHRDSSASARPV